MSMLSDEELADIRDARRMLARFESERGGFDIAPMTVRGLLAHIDALTAQRDRARDIAVSLEQELAEVQATPQRWVMGMAADDCEMVECTTYTDPQPVFACVSRDPEHHARVHADES